MKAWLFKPCEKTRAELFVTLCQQLAVQGELLGIRCVGFKQRFDVLGVVGIKLCLHD